MSKKSILELLIADNINGATPISIDTTTIPTLKGGQKNPHQGRITKYMQGANVMVFQNKKSSSYGDMVARRLKAEGKDPDSFVLGPRSWGTRREGQPFVDHKGEVYLEVIFLKSPGKKVTYVLDGTTPIDKADIEGLDDKEEGEQGGLDNKVIIRTFKVSNVVGITISGEYYDQSDLNHS